MPTGTRKEGAIAQPSSSRFRNSQGLNVGGVLVFPASDDHGVGALTGLPTVALTASAGTLTFAPQRVTRNGMSSSIHPIISLGV
jgi:hypothetical protein